ncbi:MAG: hypothetical protein J6L82_00285 [Alphaproteobacteria bacterium]|nr:hypothetical protein [Alphaproteobacteria bacterium]
MILIDDSLKALLPRAALGVLSCAADVAESGAGQLEEFDKLTEALETKYPDLPFVAQNPHVAATREAYKALGKDPSKYRNSAEAMLRRIAKKNGLYRVNNAVDINNMVSVESGYSLGSYDLAAVKGQIVWKRTPDGEKYQGIGKDVLNIEHLPALYDDEGVFGNPTSDSRRTMINPGQGRRLLYVIYAFDGVEELPAWLDKTEALLVKFAAARDVEKQIIKC